MRTILLAATAAAVIAGGVAATVALSDNSLTVAGSTSSTAGVAPATHAGRHDHDVRRPHGRAP